MFEEYVKRMEALENEVEELGDRLNSSTKLIATQLDVTQNQIMHLNLHVCTFPHSPLSFAECVHSGRSSCRRFCECGGRCVGYEPAQWLRAYDGGI